MKSITGTVKCIMTAKNIIRLNAGNFISGVITSENDIGDQRGLTTALDT